MSRGDLIAALRAATDTLTEIRYQAQVELDHGGVSAVDVEEVGGTIHRCEKALRGGAAWTTYEVLEACQRALGITKDQANRVILELRRTAWTGPPAAADESPDPTRPAA